MNRVREMASRGTVLSAVGLLAAVAFASTTMGQQSTPDALATWVTFEPAISDAVTSQDYGVFPAIDESERNRIKVGQPYALADYDLTARLGWTGELLWNPNRAVAKRTFKMYKLDDMDSEKWQVLRKEFDGNPASVALVSPSGGGYVGTPVKWNNALADAFMSGYVAAEKANDTEKWIVKAMAGEILNIGTLGTQPLVPGSSPPGFVTVDQLDQADFAINVLSAYDSGDVAAVEYLVPEADIFIAISDTPAKFDVDHIGEVITQSGYWGQPLGTVMPSWPSKDD